MSSHEFDELESLIARASDGTLSSDEADRLNQFLCADPKSQDQYLDHMFLDGMLEQEFQGVPSPVALVSSTSAPSAPLLKRSPRVVWYLVPVLLIALMGAWWLPQSNRLARHSVPLLDSGFETGDAGVTGKQLKNAWYGDVVDVVEQYSEVVPHEGNRMVRFVKSSAEPQDACELYQIVDVRHLSSILGDRVVTAEASAFFNSISETLGDEDCVFGITIFSSSSDPSEELEAWPMRWDQSLAFSGSQTVADSNPKSWQQVKTRLSLSSETKFLIVQLAVTHTNSDDEDDFPGQFADGVQLELVSLR